MSLAKLKAKETKGKHKTLPKLKAILANPIKTKCPTLDDEEMNQLKTLLKKSMADSNLEPKQFANQKCISLGLESSLRKINGQSSSCVFLSLSIRPNHLIGLIARNAESKDETLRVYAQPKLENFIEELFGIQALCMAFPKDLIAIGETLSQWIEKHKKPVKLIKKIATEKKTLKKKIKKIKTLETLEKEEEMKTIQQETKTQTGEFMSFGKDDQAIKNDVLLDGDEAVDALSVIINKIPTSNVNRQEHELKSEPMEVDSVENISVTTNPHGLKDDDVSENSDDFLGGYKALIVHKIKGNPNRKPKKKRKKNKKNKNPAK